CASPGLVQPTGNCTAGYFCAGNASVSAPIDGITGDKCPVGLYCPEGSPQPITCEPGTFTDTDTNSECLLCTPGHYCITGTNPQDCPAGFYCPEGTGHVWQSCPAGTFSANVGLANSSQCTQCTTGFYCSETNATTVTGPCDPGFFCRSGSDAQQPTGLTAGDAGVCPMGHYCEAQTGEPTACPPGTFNNDTGLVNEASCQQCLPGHYCDVPGLSFPTGLCDPGFYCFLGSNISNPTTIDATGGPCPSGTFCLEGSSIPQYCPAGSYSPIAQQANCTVCPAGYYCLSGSSNITECPTGHYCSLGTEFDTQYPCFNGSFNNATKGSSIDDCLLCTPGSYCPGQGLTEPAGTCAPGFYCSLGSWAYKPSVLGNDTGSACNCPAQSIGGMCVAGEYCPAGSAAPVPCDPGFHCLTDELDAVSGPCQAGYFCNGSTILPNPVDETTGDICPKGHYCPEQSSAPIACDPGYYSNAFANQNVSNCLLCTAGMYCSSYGLPLPDDQCDEGWFCPEGETTPQPPGKQCLAGHRCPRGSPMQYPCESGEYQPLPGEGECLSCPPGKYCDRNDAISENQSGAGAPSHGVVTPKDCPAGFYCPNGTETARANPCPVGTYSNTTMLENATECRLCPQGHYCEAVNITEPTGLCSPGFYCVLGAINPIPADASEGGGPCPQGTYCAEGWDWPTPCPKGTYGDRAELPGLSDCTLCPPGEFCAQSGLSASNGSCLGGFYCSNASQSANPVGELYGDECPAGYFCPEGSYMPIACPPGTYNPNKQMVDDTACNPCDAGMYCGGSGLANVSGPCDAGFYCTGGSNTSAPTDGTTGDICPAGSACPEGSSIHKFCENGTYTNHTGASVCYECPPGFYCTNRDRADECPTGHYCPPGTGADIMPCPAGTYNPITGLHNITECTQCDGGSYCLTPGLSAVSGNCTQGYYCTSGVDLATPTGGHTGIGDICPTGYYCPGGTTEPIPCAPGTYAENEGQPLCNACPAGYYCLVNSTTYTHQVCPSGYYCPQGTRHSFEFPCPKGSYNPATQSTGPEDCLACPPGEYCETDGMSATSGDCSAGWYCTGGSFQNQPIASSNVSDWSDCSCPNLNYTGGRCYPGYYCPIGSHFPVSCDGGSYCGTYDFLSGLALPTDLCDAGYYCDGNASEANPADKICPPGYYCESGSATPTPCPAGTFSNDEGNVNVTDCQPCTPGYYCSGTANTNVSGPCAPMYYCPAGQDTATPVEYNCTIGHYCP
ncbi:unnamed protein product, partial [Owenia fusiformis]